MQANALLQAQVNQILADLYAAFPGKTSVGGNLNVGGTNAAPSGTYEAPADCGTVTGKHAAYELLNDTCGVSTKHWTTVSFTA